MGRVKELVKWWDRKSVTASHVEWKSCDSHHQQQQQQFACVLTCFSWASLAARISSLSLRMMAVLAFVGKTSANLWNLDSIFLLSIDYYCLLLLFELSKRLFLKELIINQILENSVFKLSIGSSSNLKRQKN